MAPVALGGGAGEVGAGEASVGAGAVVAVLLEGALSHPALPPAVRALTLREGHTPAVLLQCSWGDIQKTDWGQHSDMQPEEEERKGRQDLPAGHLHPGSQPSPSRQMIPCWKSEQRLGQRLAHSTSSIPGGHPSSVWMKPQNTAVSKDDKT